MEQRYKNARELYHRYNNKMTHSILSTKPERDGRFMYSIFNGDSVEWYSVDCKTGAKTLTQKPAEEKRHKGNGAPQHHWMEVLDEKDGKVQSPIDTSLVIFHKDNNLYLQNKSDASSIQVTTDGTDSCYYSSWGSWSKDGRYYATVMITPAPKHYVTYTLSSPKDQVQPRYSQQEYAKPGDSLNYRVPVIVDVKEKRTIRPKSNDLFLVQYYLSAPVWDRNCETVTFEFNERGHKTFRVLEMNMKGDVKTLIEERDEKYVAYSRNYRYDMKNGNIIWKSDRDGRAHLYLLNRRSGKLTQITKGDYWVRDVQRVDEDEKGNATIFFSANGKNCGNIGALASSFDASLKAEDPYNIHYYNIKTDGKRLTELTPEEGNHSATFFWRSGTMLDSYSTPMKSPVSCLRSIADGKVIKELEHSDTSKLSEAGWKAPEVFVAPGRDGKTDIWGLIQRPSDFDPTKKYPVIEYIYSGPGGQYVPKSFNPTIWNLSELAELGFIVVQMDGMTTSFRTLEFEQVCYKNLKDAGFPDRIAWMKAAAEKYPYMDLERVGIYGASAGGQEALGALLFYPEFYKVAYASCGCHDNRMDKIWWNEQWMGWPVDSSYVESSNVVNAHKLQGKLMLVVGEMDDNVDPASSYQVVDALIKANKDFEFVLLPGVRHTMGETYGLQKRYDFFVRNLLGKEPPAWK